MLEIPTTENIILPFNILLTILFIIFVIGAGFGYKLQELLKKYIRFVKYENSLNTKI